MAKICPSCGYEAADNEKFCTSCGAKLDVPAESVAEAEPVVPAAEAEPVAPVSDEPVGDPAAQFAASQTGVPQYSAPQDRTPQYGASQNSVPQYGMPQNGAPQYGAPQNGSPQYGAPQNGTPQNGTPQYGAPQYGAPQYGASQYGAPQYGAPQYTVPQYNSPTAATATVTKKKTGLIIGIAVGAVVLIAIIVAVIMSGKGGNGGSNGGSSGSGSTALNGSYSLTGMTVNGEDYSSLIGLLDDEYHLTINGDDCTLELGDEKYELKINQSEHYLYAVNENDKIYFTVNGSSIFIEIEGTGKDVGKRHPTLGNNVLVGVGAAVLGNITVGDNSKVGGGAVVVKDVPPNTTVVGIPGHVVVRDGQRVRDEQLDRANRKENLPDPMEEQIATQEARLEALENKIVELTALLEEKGK